MPGAVVADVGVEDVGAPSCQADGDLDRFLALVAFGLVVHLRAGSQRAAVSAHMYITRRSRRL